MNGVKVMKKRLSMGLMVSALFTLIIFAASQSVYAHCDTLDGPHIDKHE